MAAPPLPAHVIPDELIESAWGNQVVDWMTALNYQQNAPVQFVANYGPQALSVTAGASLATSSTSGGSAWIATSNNVDFHTTRNSIVGFVGNFPVAPAAGIIGFALQGTGFTLAWAQQDPVGSGSIVLAIGGVFMIAANTNWHLTCVNGTNAKQLGAGQVAYTEIQRF